MESSGDWDGLRTLWRGLKRVGAALMLGIVGGFIGGVTGAVATFYCYGIGLYLGLPAGFILGVILGTRIAPRDAAISFTLCFGTLWLALRFRSSQEGSDEFLSSLLAVGIAAAVGATSLLIGRILPRPEARYYLAVTLTTLFSIICIINLLRHLYGPG